MKTEIIKTKYVTEAEKKALFVLLCQFFVNTDYERFLADFSEKQWLIRMSDGDEITGFSTQQTIELTVAERPVRFLFSGDTIVHPDYWNKSYLAGAFGQLFLHIGDLSEIQLFWFLVSKGFRTYRVMPVHFKKFHPVHTSKNRDLKPLLDAVAAFKFGANYNPETELVKFTEPKDYLCGSLADIPANYANNPHVSFFAKRNPEYRLGTELACIASLSKKNLTKCSQRVIKSTKVEWHV